MDYIYNPDTGELYHYGIKGMKWGVRRYQNKDGTLTAAGRRKKKREARNEYHMELARSLDRYDAELDRLAKSGRGNDSEAQKRALYKQVDEADAAKAKYQQTKRELNDQAKRAREAKKADNYHSDYKRAHDKTNVKNMSDKELRERINRLQMEKQYSQLNQREKSAGEKFVKGVITTAATVAVGKYANQYASDAVGFAISKAQSAAWMIKAGKTIAR